MANYTRNRLVLGGPTAFGDTWSVGLAVRTTSAMSQGTLEAWLAGIADDVKASYYTAGSNCWGAAAAVETRLAYMAAYHYDGSTPTAQFTARYEWSSPIQGSGSSAGPGYVAMCCSLLTGSAGRSNRGRIYVPAEAAGYASGQFGASVVDTVGAGVRDLIDHINGSTIGGEAATVIIAGKNGPIDVSRVRVDSIPDTQRPRFDNVNPLHTFSDDV